MSVLTVQNISHGFGDRAIFEDVSFRLLKGEHVGFIGANGEGKSTFLNIITGKLVPDEGKVIWSNGVKVGYLDQHTTLTSGKTIRDVLRDAFENLYALEEKMLKIGDRMADVSGQELEKLLEEMGNIQDILESSGFYMIDAQIEEVANGLGLGAIGLDREVQDLSGGQRTKVLLAKLLLEKPTILLLDEPTNYLDAEHIEWLTKFLQEYENSFILISHDIEFLNKVVNIIYHVENRELTRYVGNYNDFVRLYEIKKEQQLNAYHRQQQEIAKLEDFIARNKARVATRGMANSRQKRLDKMELIEKPREKAKPTFFFKEARTPGRFIFTTQDLVIGYDKPLTKPLNICLERGQKVAVIGCNGLGKSTLLKTLLGLIPCYEGKIEHGDYVIPGYFEQELNSDNENTALEELWHEFPSYTQFEVRQALALAGLGNDRILSKMKVLSGGEQAKVRLSKLMQRECNVLILDEPTNHLDVDAKEELKKALKEFKGTILLVCHEPEFYQDWVTDVWSVEDWSNKIV
ncbi:ABC-F family ATP-binding cassette domain-containing protein [Thermotalea metallivorans]|uniref:Putative ABC transporter ATP-binding protein YbiT n=1 Tax=Thermotalea metallivorans TaxID=520762 RepID=A0A140L5S5_9FIRM|nr:ABC-F family ATP-binding cassette domain-containing protein [Thermotalea metallivorans]KXG75900.1 putative ABC transporter ATP-binding protein YbiT [Thermotalea metallivorans]